MFAKNSLDRFGDDLLELLLSYIPLDDSFRFSCVSKQWRRLIFNKHTVLRFGCEKIYANHPEQRRSKIKVSIQAMDKIFSNCYNIRKIYLNIDFLYYENIKQFIEILKNYKKINEFHIKTMRCMDEKTLRVISLNFGPIIKSINGFYEHLSKKSLKMCYNINHLSHLYKFDIIFDNNEILLNNSKFISFEYSSNDKRS